MSSPVVRSDHTAVQKQWARIVCFRMELYCS
jgi:hypothetical protein